MTGVGSTANLPHKVALPSPCRTANGLIRQPGACRLQRRGAAPQHIHGQGRRERGGDGRCSGGRRRKEHRLGAFGIDAVGVRKELAGADGAGWGVFRKRGIIKCAKVGRSTSCLNGVA